MAKKKNQSKKHKFKHVDPLLSSDAQPAAAGTSAGDSAASVPAKSKRDQVGGSRDFSYVSHDLRRIAVLAVALVGFQVALWFVFTHSGVGNAVYNAISV